MCCHAVSCGRYAAYRYPGWYSPAAGIGLADGAGGTPQSARARRDVLRASDVLAALRSVVHNDDVALLDRYLGPKLVLGTTVDKDTRC